MQYNIYDVAMYTFVDLLILAFNAEEDSSLGLVKEGCSLVIEKHSERKSARPEAGDMSEERHNVLQLFLWYGGPQQVE